LPAKARLLHAMEIASWCGGTFFEMAWAEGKLAAYAAWLRRIGIRHLEISDGTVSIEPQERARLIREIAAGGFTVVTEIGKKARDVEPDPAAWIAAIRADLAAGAESVILEGRESGTAGLYTADGAPRPELLQALIAAELPVEQLIFEAPRTAQQATLITQFGPEVSFGNIAWHDLIPLETLRRGLRGDTAGSITRDTLLYATRRAS
jgi:phosphosulfolactate synthase